MIRLLHEVSDRVFALTSFEGNQIPEYAILSHTWGDEEVLFHEIHNIRPSEETREKAGYKKLEFCAAQVKEHGLRYFWCDTCCIDKRSSAELQEAINSMFEWYKNAQICYAYLSDVPDTGGPSTLPFRQSRWFTRGWTLQELIAPRGLEFYSFFGKLIDTRWGLAEQLQNIINVPAEVLTGIKDLTDFSIVERIGWARNRMTKRREDGAYSLFGLLDMPLGSNYGEGSKHAFQRLYIGLTQSPPVVRGSDHKNLSDDEKHKIWEALQAVQELQARHRSTHTEVHPYRHLKHNILHVAVLNMCSNDVQEFLEALGDCVKTSEGWCRAFRDNELHFHILQGFDQVDLSDSDSHSNSDYEVEDAESRNPLGKLAQQLCHLYREGLVFESVVYIYPKSELVPRFSTVKAFCHLENIYGPERNTLCAVVGLETTFQCLSPDSSFVRFEEFTSEIIESAHFLDGVEGTVDSFLSAIVSARDPTVLQIQNEMVDEDKPFSATTVGQGEADFARCMYGKLISEQPEDEDDGEEEDDEPEGEEKEEKGREKEVTMLETQLVQMTKSRDDLLQQMKIRESEHQARVNALERKLADMAEKYQKTD